MSKKWGLGVLLVGVLGGVTAHADDDKPKDEPKNDKKADGEKKEGVKGAELTFTSDDGDDASRCDACSKAESGWCDGCKRKLERGKTFAIPLKGLKAEDDARVTKALEAIPELSSFGTNTKAGVATIAVDLEKHVSLSTIEKALAKEKIEIDRKAPLSGTFRLVVEGADVMKKAVQVLKAVGIDVDDTLPDLDKVVKRVVEIDTDKKTGSFKLSCPVEAPKDGTKKLTLESLADAIKKTGCKLADVTFDEAGSLTFQKK